MMVHAAPGAVLTMLLAAFPCLTGDVTEVSTIERCSDETEGRCGPTEGCCGSTERCCGTVVHERVPRTTTIHRTCRGDRTPLECRIVTLLFKDPAIQDAAGLNFGKYQGLPA